jgi:cation transport regulator
MLYNTNQDLPVKIRQQLPPRAQDIYREAYNDAQYVFAAQGFLDDTADEVAWGAVKRLYRKEDGVWVLRHHDYL